MVKQAIDRDFNRRFFITLGGHILLLGLAFVGGENLSKTFDSQDTEIIRSAVRVDVVGMPKFTIQELKKMQALPVNDQSHKVIKKVMEEANTEADDVIKKDDLVILEKGKKKKSFLNMLNNYSSQEVIAKASKKGSKATTSIKALNSLIVEGNRISKGSALVGDYTDEQNSEFSAYVQNIPGVIRPAWKLPDYLMNRNLKCRIKIYLSRQGKLLKLEVLESSGESEFDQRAQNAIREASFPVPSEEVGTRLTQSGIILGFPI